MSTEAAVSPSPIKAVSSGTLAPLALLGSMTSVCLGATFAHAMFATAGAAGTTSLRIALAALMLAALRRPWRQRLAPRDLGRIALFGTVLGLMNLCFYMAIRSVPIGLSIAIEFVGPLAVALLASRRALDLVWIALAVAGLVLLLPLHGLGAGLDPVGVGFALTAACFWAAYIVTGQRLAHLDGGQAVSLALAIGALAVLPFGVIGAGRTLLDPSLLAIGLVVALLSSAVPYSLEIFALRHLPRQTFGVLLSLEPAIGALVGLAFLGQHLRPVQWAAIACIVAASAGTTLAGRRSRRQAAAVPA
jgi:inner membrane transporter RhtA